MAIGSIKRGSLYVITGGMKGTKTLQFISVFEKLKYAHIKAQIFTPANAYRKELHEEFNLSRDHIVSRTGAHLPAIEIDEKKPKEILNRLYSTSKVIGIEEVNLFKKPEELVDVVMQILNMRKATVVSGLDKNFRGEPFDPMPSLMAYAADVDKNYGVCDVQGCKRDGEYPQRIVNGKPAHYDSPIIVPGADEAYEIRCLKHHEVPGKP